MVGAAEALARKAHGCPDALPKASHSLLSCNWDTSSYLLGQKQGLGAGRVFVFSVREESHQRPLTMQRL